MRTQVHTTGYTHTDTYTTTYYVLLLLLFLMRDTMKTVTMTLDWHASVTGRIIIIISYVQFERVEMRRCAAVRTLCAPSWQLCIYTKYIIKSNKHVLVKLTRGSSTFSSVLYVNKQTNKPKKITSKTTTTSKQTISKTILRPVHVVYEVFWFSFFSPSNLE